MAKETDNWVSFWDTDHPIYVNARHFDVHYRAIADDIVALIPSPTAHVLDHGCGEALHADEIAARCGELLLCEAAPTVRTRVAERFKSEPKIHALSPEKVDKLPDYKDPVALALMRSIKQALDPQNILNPGRVLR